MSQHPASSSSVKGRRHLLDTTFACASPPKPLQQLGHLCAPCLRRAPIRFAPTSITSVFLTQTGRVATRPLERVTAPRAISLCRLYTTRLPMSTTDAASTPKEPAGKRRRISTTSIEDRTDIAMAIGEDGQPLNHPPIKLTKREQALRLLVLDVAAHIQRERSEQTGEDVEAPELRFAGGWVRDKILSGVSSQDIDMGISNMTGHQFGLEMEKYLADPGKLEGYAQLASDGEDVKEDASGAPDGTSFDRAVGSLHKIAANPEKSKHLETCKTRVFNLELDLVNFRKETYTEESRNPQVEFGTPLEDALRRDATINALFYNLQTSSVEDFTGMGLRDMQDKLLRTPMVPLQTFQDDPLRVLRLVRFASRLGFRIHADTQEAMRDEDVKRSFKAKISPERVGAELQKMLSGPDPLAALQYIDRFGLYDTILPSTDSSIRADTTDWQRAYTSLHAAINDEYDGLYIPAAQKASTRRLLIRNNEDRYYAWMIAALCPWATTSPVPPTKKAGRPVSRAAAVARDSLRIDSKVVKILSASGQHHRAVADLKTSFLSGDLGNTTSDARWKIGDCLRTVGREWRFCVLQAMLLEIMHGADPADVFRDYEQLLLYIEEQALLEVDSLRPCVDGRAVSKALGVKAGAWTGKAMEMVVEWQVRNPEKTGAEEAIASVIQRKGELGLK